jgi:RimJ/RimL family protein N-acetyltransferase
MNITVKKTTELSESEQCEILALFNTVFKKDRTIEHFRNQFFNTVSGYSYHALLYNGNSIVGCYSYIPYYYRIENKRCLAAVGVDLMIRKKYQGQGYFEDMFSACVDYMKNDNVAFIIGFPNDIAYPGCIKLTPLRDVGNLTVYALPYRIGGIKTALKALNWLSISLANLFVFLTSLFAGSKKHVFLIEKDPETHNLIRYSQPNGRYNTEQYKGGGFVYKIMDYENIRTAFLIDVFSKSARNFNTAVRHIIKKHHKEFDIILYVGRLPFGLHGLIKIPRRFSPKNFHFVGKLLTDGVMETNLFFDIDNWDVNLSNYDLL